MATYDRGDLLRFGNPSQDTESAPFSNLAGTPTNPTAVVLTIKKPDLETLLVYGWPSAGADGVLTNESPGRFYFDVALDQSGNWDWRLEGTGTVMAASEGRITVRRSLVLT